MTAMIPSSITIWARSLQSLFAKLPLQFSPKPFPAFPLAPRFHGTGTIWHIAQNGIHVLLDQMVTGLWWAYSLWNLVSSGCCDLSSYFSSYPSNHYFFGRDSSPAAKLCRKTWVFGPFPCSLYTSSLCCWMYVSIHFTIISNNQPLQFRSRFVPNNPYL